MAGSDPVETLERWCDHGADYRVLHLSERRAIVQLCTCSGEPVDRLESGDPRLIEYLQAHSSATFAPEPPD
jgi:hypothetical protein